MKRNYKVLFIVVFVLFLAFPSDSYALTRNELSSRTVCPNFEVGIAKEDRAGDPNSTRIESLGCYDKYEDALKKMNDSSNNDTILLQRKDNFTRIINRKAPKWGL